MFAKFYLKNGDSFDFYLLGTSVCCVSKNVYVWDKFELAHTYAYNTYACVRACMHVGRVPRMFSHWRTFPRIRGLNHGFSPCLLFRIFSGNCIFILDATILANSNKYSSVLFRFLPSEAMMRKPSNRFFYLSSKRMRKVQQNCCVCFAEFKLLRV